MGLETEFPASPIQPRQSQAKPKSRADDQCTPPRADVARQANEEPISAQATQDVKEEAEEKVDEEDAQRLDAGVWEKLRKRRLQPGAATSDADFQDFFTKLGRPNAFFQETPAEGIDASDTILERVRNIRDHVTRLSVGALAFARVRQADIFLREHAMVYWIGEGGLNLRFHAGDCNMRTPSGAFQQHRGVPPDHSRVQTFHSLGRPVPATTATM